MERAIIPRAAKACLRMALLASWRRPFLQPHARNIGPDAACKMLHMHKFEGQKYNTKQTNHTVLNRARVQHCNTAEHD
jgi:hypothetical protein